MKHLIISMTIIFLLSMMLAKMTSGDENSTTKVSAVRIPPTKSANRHYVSNRPPLLPSPLVKLPIGNIEPQGWLLSQLQLMRDGFTGHLPELSKFLKPDSGWLTLERRGWEEMPYWLKGFGDLGYVLKDPEIIEQARIWLDAVLSSQQPDGYFGPPENKKDKDLWPNMVVLFTLQSFYEATGDERVIPFMTRYFRYQHSLPEEDLLPGSWQKLRGGDNLESVYWLYNRTGEKFLLELGQRLYKRTSDWTFPLLTPERDKDWKPSLFYHGVNIAMGFRQPGVFYQQSKDKKHIEAVERNYRMVRDEYGQQPGGMFGADENIRPGYTDPRYAAETCSMVEFMYSDESLLKISGETRYAERCEEIAFNSFPASMTADLKALHYLTAPNLISCDSSGEHDYQNKGTMVSFDPWRYRCCQHNVAFGWPYYAEHLWFSTADNGLAAVLYAPSQVRAKVAGGTEVRISEDTWYPFGDSVEFTIRTDTPVSFPLYLRIPEWTEQAKILINGKRAEADLRPGQYAVIEREWKNADKVKLELPMEIKIKTWEKAANSVSVKRGPLWYSLRIGEEHKRYAGTEEWPAWEIIPTTPWNYGLIIDPKHPEDSITLQSQKPPAFQPFTPEAAPILLQAKAKRIPQWTAEGQMVGKLPQSPVKSAEPVEKIILIPMGCARLRIASFPTIEMR